jgi:hypothetical protein
MQQRRKEPRPNKLVTSGKREDIQRSPGISFRSEGRSGRVFRQTLEDAMDIVEGPAPS